jgi:hypothetical protein
MFYIALTRAEEQLHIISGQILEKTENYRNNMSSLFIKFLDDIGLMKNHLEYELSIKYQKLKLIKKYN